MSAETIPCPVCLDLMPLVRDGVASPESAALVEAHLAECGACRALWEGEGPLLPSSAPAEAGGGDPAADRDRRVLRAIRRRLMGAGLLLLGAGGLLGILLSNSAGMFYNFLIMPAVGALGVATLGRRWWLAPSAILALSFLWVLLSQWADSGRFSPWMITGALFFAAAYAILTWVGAVIAALLRHAFRKEEPPDARLQ